MDPLPRPDRSNNLDLLRAAAILGVLVYHVVQRWPTPMPALEKITQYGSRGVDLFFVLSGYLIGGLVWREIKQFGGLDVPLFLGRRMSRTFPAYFAALGIAYGAVRHSRHERFDWTYLVFLQNMREHLPFFKVSWSLCIEEHFYLVFPFLILVVRRRLRWILLACFVLITGTVASRAIVTTVRPYGGFDFSTSATPFRLDGLTLGFALAAVRSISPAWFARIKKWSPYGAAGGLAAYAACLTVSIRAEYVFGPLLLSAGLAFLVALLIDRPAILGRLRRPVYWVAVASYSTYLVHAFAIDMALRIINQERHQSDTTSAAIFVVLIAAVSGTFYLAVERPSMWVRDRYLPGRARSAADQPAVTPGHRLAPG